MDVIYIRSDLLTESFIELRIAVEFLSERNYGYEILNQSINQSINQSDYLDRGLFVKAFFNNLIKIKRNFSMDVTVEKFLFYFRHFLNNGFFVFEEALAL